MLRTGLLLAAVIIATPAIAQRPQGFPDVDPMDEASCDVEGGWMTVFSEFANAWTRARDAGRLVDPLLTELAVWYIKQENRILETDDVRGVCLDTIAIRRQHGF